MYTKPEIKESTRRVACLLLLLFVAVCLVIAVAICPSRAAGDEKVLSGRTTMELVYQSYGMKYYREKVTDTVMIQFTDGMEDNYVVLLDPDKDGAPLKYSRFLSLLLEMDESQQSRFNDEITKYDRKAGNDVGTIRPDTDVLG